MNILFLSEQFPPYGSGAELATYLYARLLSEEDFNVVVVTNSFSGKTEISKSANLVIYRLPIFKGTAIKYSILRRFDALFSNFMGKLLRWTDIVYIPRFWYSAIPLAKIYGKPVVTHLHDYITCCPLSIAYNYSRMTVCGQSHVLCTRCICTYEEDQKKGLKDALVSVALNSSLGRCLPKLVRLSDAVICVSKAQRGIVTEKEHSLYRKTHVVYNPLPELSKVNMKGDDFGYFGGASRLKGLFTLYQAMVRVNRTGRNLTRIHATKFPSREERLASFFSKSGFLLYGKLDNSEYEKLYQQVRAVVVPSLWHEPSPYVVDEAMLRGRVVIASSVGGIPEQVNGSEGAFLFESGNIGQLTEKINLVNALTRENAINLGVENRESLMKTRNNAKTIKSFITILNKVAE